MTVPPDIFSIMTVHALDVSTATAEAVALERWGIAGRAKALTGERDRNFHLRAEDGSEFVLKFANPVEDAAVTDMQVQALRHIARVDPDLPVPRVVPLPDGSLEAPVPHETGGIQRVRLLTWLPGVALAESRRSAAQRVACGVALARMQLALRDFRHPATGHALIWDLQHALRLREVAFAVQHAGAREVVAELLDAFEAQVTPALRTLRRQVLYNDMNGYNTLVDAADNDRFAGQIDFGDMVETAVAIDVATAVTSQLGNDMPAAESLGHFVGAVHAICPLHAEEVALLQLLMACRIGMSIVLQSWHRHVQPENPHYDDVTPELVEERLRAIADVLEPATGHAMRRACGMG
jgi:Ser/Thr protein kinase RdoA (MazF antagonist)